MNTSRILCVCLFLVIAGCSQMRVQVEILDRRYRDEAVFVEAKVTAEANRIEGLLAKNTFGKLEQKLEADTTKALQALNGQSIVVGEKTKPVRIPNELATQLSRDLVSEVNIKFSDARRNFSNGLEKLHNARLLPSNDASRVDAYRAAGKDFETGRGVFAAIKSNINGILVTKLRSPTSPSKIVRGGSAVANEVGPPDALELAISTPVAEAVQSVASEAIASLVSNDIFNDPFASVVINAPDEFWQGTYNRTYGLGTVGNTDIAIKMESAGNFTIKGVREDASKVTPAAFQGIQQALKVAAAFEGIPLPSAAASSTGTSAATGGLDASGNPKLGSNATATSEIATADSDLKAAQLKLVRSRAAALSILTAIVNDRVAITNTSGAADAVAALAKAVSDIKATFTAAKGDLEMN